MELTLNISAIVAIIGALTVLTNIIVEVLKRATWEKMPTNLLAIIVAMVLTLVAPILEAGAATRRSCA